MSEHRNESGPVRPRQNKTIEPGTILWSRYEIKMEITSSRLGQLWHGLDQQTGADTAIRLLPPEFKLSKTLLLGIQKNIQLVAHRSHPHVAPVRQMTYVGPSIFLIGDFAPGQSLEDWRRSKPGGPACTLAEIQPLLAAVAAGLDFAHECGIVYNNVSPVDIFMDGQGGVQLTDLGLPTNEQLTVVRGQVHRAKSDSPYLAPEVAKTGRADSAGDQYAMAVLCLDLLAGRTPSNPPAIPADLPKPAAAALRRALSPNPDKRFVTCSDFLAALNGAKITARRPVPAEKRKKIFIACAAVLLGLLGAGILAGLIINRPDTSGAELVERTVAPAPAAPVAPPPPQRVVPLQAVTDLPEANLPWVAQTVPMEFVWVDAMHLWVGRFEVTNEEYAKMNSAHNSGDHQGLRLNGKRQPVVRLDFDETIAYAVWLTAQERAAGKLPADWEYRLPTRQEAIDYTRAGTRNTYPWGNDWPPTAGNYADMSLHDALPEASYIRGYRDGHATTAPVEESGVNSWGLFGAGGNVWETLIKSTADRSFGGWQGGGWDDHGTGRLRSDASYGFHGNARGDVNGFRLLLAPIRDR